MTEKIKLYALGNSKDYNYNYYIFDKTKEVHQILERIFEDIFKVRWPVINESMDKNDNPVEIPVNIEKNTDFHETLDRTKKKEERIDIFYGHKRMFVFIHSSPELRLEFNKKLNKVVTMPEEKKSNT